MSKIYNSISELVGNTPLLRLSNYIENTVNKDEDMCNVK